MPASEPMNLAERWSSKAWCRPSRRWPMRCRSRPVIPTLMLSPPYRSSQRCMKRRCIMLDMILFVIFPYVAVTLAIGGTLYRYFTNQFSFTSLSSQFLESDMEFWGSVLWHYGIIPTLLIHLAGFAIPRVMAFLHGTPDALYLSELAGKIFGLMALAGAVALLIRRLRSSKIRVVTTPMDWVILVLLINQVFLGLWMAFLYRWGATWFIHTVTPWVVSLATFHPAPQFVAALPLV